MMDRLSKAYQNDVGMDISVTKIISLLPKQYLWIDLDMSIEVAPGYLGLIQPRSSAAKRGILIANCPIDPDYTGSIHVMVFNCSNETITISPGEKFCQLVMVRCEPNPYGIVARKSGLRGNNGEGSTGK